jgi:outer membrane protein OmpA-like peptidoglycan-associated protein
MSSASTTSSFEAGSASHSTSSTTSTQRMVRVAGGPSPYVWRGLLPTLGLAAVFWFALAPFAANDIEAGVRREVSSQLQQQGHGWAKVFVTGQEVLLSGTPPRPGAGDEALAAARAASCATWAGPQACAVTVLGAFAAAPSAAAPAVPAAQAMPSPAPAAPTAAVAPPAPSQAPSPAAIACEAALAKLLETSRIEFASGGSTIDAGSDKLLDQLAQAARGCPGRILVEGHTDNVGDPAANQRLSEARAGAVRDALVRRGIPAVRLETLGFGESKPRAENNSEAGRAANRRIDFKALP